MDARVQGLEHLLQMTDEEFASIDIDEATAASLRAALNDVLAEERVHVSGEDAARRELVAVPGFGEERLGAEPARFRTIVQIVPMPAAAPPIKK